MIIMMIKEMVKVKNMRVNLWIFKWKKIETIYDSKNNIIDNLNNINGFLRIYTLEFINSIIDYYLKWIYGLRKRKGNYYCNL